MKSNLRNQSKMPAAATGPAHSCARFSVSKCDTSPSRPAQTPAAAAGIFDSAAARPRPIIPARTRRQLLELFARSW
jgi:hypothetical protein